MLARRGPSPAFLALVAAVAAPAGPALGQTGPYYAGGLASYSYQSNVLGLADGVPVPTLLGYKSKSDHVRTLSVLAGLDQTFGRQRLHANGTLRNNKFSENSILDNTGYQLDAGLDWETVHRLSGTLAVKSDRQLIKFGTFDRPTGNRNLVRNTQVDADAKLGSNTPLVFSVEGRYRSRNYSDPSYDSRDQNQTTFGVGAKYSPRGRNYVGLKLRDTNGKYPHYTVPGTEIDGDHLDRQDVDLTGFVEFSQLSTLFARLSYSKIDYKVQDRLNFSGLTGLVKASWQATGKIRLSGQFARDRSQDLNFELDPFGTQVEAARLATIARATADYQFSAKLAFSANAGYTRRSLAVVNDIFGINEGGNERTNDYGFGAKWTPTRTSLVGCDYSHERRRSNLVERLNVSGNVFSCYAQLTVQP